MLAVRPSPAIRPILKLANSWQIGFLREIPRKGKSANHRVFTDDCDGGPGWTCTTDLALIRIEAVSTSARNAGFFEGRGRLRRYPPLAVFLLLGFHIRLHDEDAAPGL